VNDPWTRGQAMLRFDKLPTRTLERSVGVTSYTIERVVQNQAFLHFDPIC